MDDKNSDAAKWQQAIEDAKLAINSYLRKIRALQRAIRLMKTQIEKGEPWPKPPSPTSL
jgi:phage gp36-like protein